MASDQWSVMGFTRTILVAFSLGITCFTFSNVAFGCERSRPLAVPFPDEWQPYFETVGPATLFKVRKIEGTFEFRTFVRSDRKLSDVEIPLRNAALTLRNALSGEIVKNSKTDEEGRFDLGELPPGSYVLQIEQGEEPKTPLRIEGTIIVEVHTDAKDVHLPRVALSMSDCGMDVHKTNEEDSLKQQAESTHAQTH